MKIILTLFCFIAFIAGTAQSSKIFVYEKTLRFPESAVDQLISDVEQERDEKISDSTRQQLRSGFFEMLSSQLPQKDTLQVYRWAKHIVMKEYNTPSVTKTYTLDSLKFTVVDSGKHKANRSVDIISTNMDWQKEPGWQVNYTVIKKPDTKIIFGYKCHLYEVTQSKQTPIDHENDSTVFQLWLTDKVTPSLPAYAVLGWYQRVLPKFSVLEANVTSLRMGGVGESIRLVAIR